jgi:outer membrane protein OmpA-like peptidoglycan-associated protein/Tol biopolymer transport system component
LRENSKFDLSTVKIIIAMGVIMKRVVAVLIILTAVGQAYSQRSLTMQQNQAEKLFAVGDYQNALPLFLQLEKDGSSLAHLNYKIAKCLCESAETNDIVRSLNYFQMVDEEDFEQLPDDYYLDFAHAHMINEEIEQALVQYNKHLQLVKSNDKARKEVEQKIAQARRAFAIMRVPNNVTVQALGNGINTPYTEYNPVVSADESVMAFTTLKPVNKKTGEKLGEEIYIALNETGSWSLPKKVDINTPNNYGTAGISADGREMLIFIGDYSGGSIFRIEKDSSGWSRPVPLGSGVQSKYMESTASLTPDGKLLYFASNRPEGYGGMDIYVSSRNASGAWSRAVNLGPAINTAANEDAPFIHPNGKLLFFTTDGHDGMGGYDIYKAEMIDGTWSEPKNMGYPINSTSNDNYFTLIADGTRGYFSSDRKGGQGGQDIYVLDMPENYETIPLTMIKGRILDADTKKPMNSKIFIIDAETKEKVDYVYHPSKKTGDYLVILPPNKSYDMIIQSDGFLPYTVNIDVPNQTEFYELYQKVFLKTIKHFDVVVGQEVDVKNAFYYTQQSGKVSKRQEYESELIERDSVDAYDLMGDLIESTDQAGIDYLVQLVMIQNPIDEVDFDESNDKLQSAKRRYYYDEVDPSKYEERKVGDETIYTLPTMYVSIEAKQQRQNAKLKSADYDLKMLHDVVKVYFKAGASELNQSYEAELDKILEKLNQNPQFGVEISGYASEEGDADLNKELSNQRAISVLNYINHRGIGRRRIIAKGYGASSNEGMSKAESRRVEVKIVDLNQRN